MPQATESWLLGVDAKRLHFFHEVHNLGDRTRVAVSEQLDLHVDLGTRRTVPLPVDVRDRLTRFAGEQRAAGHPDGVGRTIRFPRS
ncbi:thioesterase family protein [Nocardia sp. NPDC060256]|uniref:thioesterase family protein n=1 Tax=unclassified Nocardia TaxID=2637762 RepID=UPI0036479EF0